MLCVFLIFSNTLCFKTLFHVPLILENWTGRICPHKQIGSIDAMWNDTMCNRKGEIATNRIEIRTRVWSVELSPFRDNSCSNPGHGDGENATNQTGIRVQAPRISSQVFYQLRYLTIGDQTTLSTTNVYSIYITIEYSTNLADEWRNMVKTETSRIFMDSCSV